jgi:hypothetical protein
VTKVWDDDLQADQLKDTKGCAKTHFGASIYLQFNTHW